MRNLIILSTLTLSLCLTNAASASEFNHNYIIGDNEILDSTSMSLADITSFLKSKAGYLASNMLPNFENTLKTPAEIIYDAAARNYDCDDADIDSPTQADKEKYCQKITINPKFLLVLLQKEQSLIEDASPDKSQLDWATGYGCPDNGTCSERWRGFGKQVNSAALQFYDYMKNPTHYPYVAGQTYTVNNTDKEAMQIRPTNQATAALYNYTPHVYNGNYNFWKIWKRYFTTTYPNKTLLQAKGEDGVWLIDNGVKRPFTSKGALSSRFDPNKIIQVDKTTLDSFPEGPAIKFPQYSLVRSPRGTVYLLVDDLRRGFASQEALRLIGVNPEEIIDADWDDINIYAEGSPITASSSYPTGALLQNKQTGGVYYVIDGTKAPLIDAIFLKTMFKGKKIKAVDASELNKYLDVPAVRFGDGELLKSPSSAAVYVIDQNMRRLIAGGDIFEGLGYKWENVIVVSPAVLAMYEDGEPITRLFSFDEDVCEDEADCPEIDASSTLNAVNE